jgi:hypothetical protein
MCTKVVATYRGIKITKSDCGYSWPNAGYFVTEIECQRDIDGAFLLGELGSAADDYACGIK